MLFQCCIWRN